MPGRAANSRPPTRDVPNPPQGSSVPRLDHDTGAVPKNRISVREISLDAGTTDAGEGRTVAKFVSKSSMPAVPYMRKVVDQGKLGNVTSWLNQTKDIGFIWLSHIEPNFLHDDGHAIFE